MSEKHPSDEILQQFIGDPAACTWQQISHIDHCPDCQACIAAYTAINDELSRLPKPAFDFDLASEVIAQMQKPPRTNTSILPKIAIAALVSVPLWLFRKSAYFVFTDMSIVFYGIVFAATAIVVTLFLFRIYKRYQQLIHLINE